jgi:hypothetical protein
MIARNARAHLGETLIEGCRNQTLREFSHAELQSGGHRRRWRLARSAAASICISIRPPLIDPELRSPTPKKPRLFFEDRDIWSTVLKIKALIG